MGKLPNRTKFAGKGENSKTPENLSGLKVKGSSLKLIFGNETLIEGLYQMGQGHGFNPQKREGEKGQRFRAAFDIARVPF
jgi:hypothetical protein